MVSFNSLVLFIIKINNILIQFQYFSSDIISYFIYIYLSVEQHLRDCTFHEFNLFPPSIISFDLFSSFVIIIDNILIQSQHFSSIYLSNDIYRTFLPSVNHEFNLFPPGIISCFIYIYFF